MVGRMRETDSSSLPKRCIAGSSEIVTSCALISGATLFIIFTEFGAMDFPPYFCCCLPTATPFSNSLPLHSSKGQMGTIKGGRKIGCFLHFKGSCANNQPILYSYVHVHIIYRPPSTRTTVHPLTLYTCETPRVRPVYALTIH
jgi:hypothetical protein